MHAVRVHLLECMGVLHGIATHAGHSASVNVQVLLGLLLQALSAKPADPRLQNLCLLQAHFCSCAHMFMRCK